MRTAPLFLVTLLCTLVATAYAHDHSQNDHSHDHADSQGDTLSAHQHGVAALNLIIEGNVLEIALDSPADNLVGFEYLPSSEADIEKVKETIAILREPQRLFAFPAAAGCTPTEVELKSPIFNTVAESSPDHEHDGHRHDHTEHAADHADSSTHNDIEAHYRFACENTAALNQIEVKLFDAFEGTEKLILQAVGERGQQGGELTPTSNVIRY